jgi:NIMA-interacting peptidyl-prolyl cis-trans isomerase 1
MPLAIQCMGLRKTYRGKPAIEAVRGIDLAIEEGECFAVLGPNGAGKTTTIEILEGLLEPTSGDVEILGMRWRDSGAAIREQIGISLQETRFSDKLTVRETLTLFRSFYGSGIEPDEVIARVSLEDKADTWYKNLSAGKRCQEPFSGVITVKSSGCLTPSRLPFQATHTTTTEYFMNIHHTYAFALLFAAAIVLASGCGRDSGSQTQGKAGPGTAPAAQPAGDSSAQASPGGEQPTELSAAHVLIMYKGSERAPAKITRTKEEALALAQEVAKKAKAEGADFAALAKEYSDCPSAAEGGNLGTFAPFEMTPPFSDAVMKLAVGEVSDPIETEFGYHVIRRQALPPKASAKHILVQYKGSMRASPDITRTKEEALARIQECVKRLEVGEKFEDLAREFSDGPTGPRGGDLGEFPQGAMVPEFDKAVFACEVGKVTDVVETPFGYHIIYRYK